MLNRSDVFKEFKVKLKTTVQRTLEIISEDSTTNITKLRAQYDEDDLQTFNSIVMQNTIQCSS